MKGDGPLFAFGFKRCFINSRDSCTVYYVFALFFQLWWIPEQNGGSYPHIKVIILLEIVS